MGAPALATAQGLSDLVRSTVRDTVEVPPPAPSTLVAGEAAAGAVLGAAAGFGVGLLAEIVCNDCDASKPGGDLPGLIVGVPAGAVLGVWLVGRTDPVSGRVADTLLGAAFGTAIFAGYAELLEEQGDLLRWAGVVIPAALATMGWNKSRAALLQPPAVSAIPGNAPRASGIQFAVLSVSF